MDRLNGDIILSIGMIIKNEEKVLRRCLESMKPIFREINCELIIADTGSTDNSVNIAQEYTDIVYYFEWIGDFSAARNSTLEKAKGKWYMFIDADEYFDSDISELLYFFSKPNLYSNNKTMSIRIREYYNKEKTKYYDIHLPKFYRISEKEDNIKFENKIHEIIKSRQPHIYIDTILHHTGYCYSSRAQHIVKSERNLPELINTYNEDKNNLRNISLLLDCSYEYPDRYEEYIASALKYIRNNRSDCFCNIIFIKSIRYYKSINPKYALELCNTYYNNSENSESIVETLEISKLKTDLLCSLKQYDNACEEYLHYQKLYKNIRSGNISDISSTGDIINGLTESEYISLTCQVAESMSFAGKYDTVEKLLENFDINKLDNDDFTLLTDILVKNYTLQKDYSSLSKLYAKILKTESKNKITYINEKLATLFCSLVTDARRRKFAKEFTAKPCSEGVFFNIMKLTLNPSASGVQKCLESINEWDNSFAEIIYMAIKYNTDLTDFAAGTDSSDFVKILEYISSCHDDYAETVLNCCISDEFLMDIKRLNWITEVYRFACEKSFTLSEDQRYTLYKTYTSLLGDFVMNLYNPDFLNEESMHTMPELHRFGFYMYNADTALINGDKTGYVRFIRKALTGCEGSKEIVEFLFDRFKAEIMG